MLKTNIYFWKNRHSCHNTQCSNMAMITKDAGFIMFVTTLLSIDCFYMKGHSYEMRLCSTHRNTCRAPEWINNVFPFIFRNCAWSVRIFSNHVQECHWPDGSYDTKYIEDRWPAICKTILCQQTTERIWYDCSKLCTCKQQQVPFQSKNINKIKCSITVLSHWCAFLSLSLSPMALQPRAGLGLLQEFPPSFPV